MKLNVVNIKRVSGDKLTLVPLGDVHYGARECKEELFQKYVDHVADNKDYRTIMMGDMINAALRDSVGAGSYDDKMNVQQQKDEILDILHPIRKKIIGYHTGNHEERIYKSTGLDISKDMAKDLGVPYLGYAAFTKLRLGKQNYCLYSTHGSSGATMPHTKIKKCLDLGASFEADIYLYAHVHRLDSAIEDKYYVDYGSKMIKTKRKTFVLTGHFLNYAGSYGEAKNLRPDRPGAPKIKLYKNKWDVHVGL